MMIGVRTTAIGVLSVAFTAQADQPTCDGVVAVRIVEAEAVSMVVDHLVRTRHVTRRDEHGALTIVIAWGSGVQQVVSQAGRRQSQQREGPRNTIRPHAAYRRLAQPPAKKALQALCVCCRPCSRLCSVCCCSHEAATTNTHCVARRRCCRPPQSGWGPHPCQHPHCCHQQPPHQPGATAAAAEGDTANTAQHNVLSQSQASSMQPKSNKALVAALTSPHQHRPSLLYSQPVFKSLPPPPLPVPLRAPPPQPSRPACAHRSRPPLHC